MTFTLFYFIGLFISFIKKNDLQRQIGSDMAINN